MKPILIIFALFILFSSSLVSAQSGRIIVPEPETETVVEEVLKVNELVPCRASDEIVVINYFNPEEFIKKLNDLGRCGYRLHGIKLWGFCHVGEPSDIRLTGVAEKTVGEKYEYNWFVARTPGEAQSVANIQGKEGFRFREKVSFLAGLCVSDADRLRRMNDKNGGVAAATQLFGNVGLFFFERKIGGKNTFEYRVLDGRITGKRGELEENNRILADFTEKGFRPVDVWYLQTGTQNAVIAEKDENVRPAGEYLYVYQLFSMNKKLTELGREGFRPLAVGSTFAVLSRKKNEPTGMKYESFQDWGGVKKLLPKWKKTGVNFIDIAVADATFYGSTDGKWIFEVPVQNEIAAPKQFEFHMLDSEDYLKRNVKKEDRDKPLTRKQFDEIGRIWSGELNRFARDGFKLVKLGGFKNPIAYFEKQTE